MTIYEKINLFVKTRNRKYLEEIEKDDSVVQIPTLLRMFNKNLKFTFYLNSHFNNLNAFALDPKEFLIFFLRLAVAFNVTLYDRTFYKRGSKNDLRDKLKKAFPILKLYEIDLISKHYEDEFKREVVKRKVKNRKKPISMQEFIDKNFTVVHTNE